MWRTVFLIGLACGACGDRSFRSDVLLPRGGAAENSAEDPVESSALLESGDILLVSGGSVARTSSPYPLHQIVAYDSEGSFKQVLMSASGTGMLWGMDLSLDGSSLLFGTDTPDYIGRLILSTLSTSIFLQDATNLTGATLRAMATLSDGSYVIAESTTSIEKYSSALARVTVNYPITTVNTVTNIHSISGGRFVVLGTATANDSPRIYNNSGTLAATVTTGLSCGTNCDPTDFIELSDGRFALASQTLDSVELYSSSFSYIGQLYSDTNVLVDPSLLAQLSNGDLLVCSTGQSICERLSISGNTASRVGTRPFIEDAGYMRQPTALKVIP